MDASTLVGFEVEASRRKMGVVASRLKTGVSVSRVKMGVLGHRTRDHGGDRERWW